MIFCRLQISDVMSAVVNTTSRPKKFEFVGGDVCLDFTNTVGGKRGATSREYLNSYADFVSWCQQADLLNESTADALLRSAARHPEESAAALRRAIALRETIYRIFAALASDESPQTPDLDHLNAELSTHLGRLQVVTSKKGFNWTWANADDALDQPLGPVARSAADLLTSPHLLEQLRQCEGDTCGWLFVDSTKNHSRRWCVMSDCGNVAKVRRFRMKNRRARSAGRATSRKANVVSQK
jgi:predicted RNA-binding Zn ribbon-like protein